MKGSCIDTGFNWGDAREVGLVLTGGWHEGRGADGVDAMA
jgi:hypothetical protein